MIAADPKELADRVSSWITRLKIGKALPGESAVGGGSLPGQILPTTLFALEGHDPERLLADLRAADPPLIGRVHDGRVLLDPRTVLPEQDEQLVLILAAAIFREIGSSL